jgi:hypothetical protein
MFLIRVRVVVLSLQYATELARSHPAQSRTSVLGRHLRHKYHASSSQRPVQEGPGRWQRLSSWVGIHSKDVENGPSKSTKLPFLLPQHEKLCGSCGTTGYTGLRKGATKGSGQGPFHGSGNDWCNSAKKVSYHEATIRYARNAVVETTRQLAFTPARSTRSYVQRLVITEERFLDRMRFPAEKLITQRDVRRS